MRKLRNVFVRDEVLNPSQQFFMDHDPDEPGLRYMIEEVHDWCLQTFGRIPRIWHQDMLDDYDNYSSYEGWVINFDNESEEMAFKLKWHGFNREMPAF